MSLFGNEPQVVLSCCLLGLMLLIMDIDSPNVGKERKKKPHRSKLSTVKFKHTSLVDQGQTGLWYDEKLAPSSDRHNVISQMSVNCLLFLSN